MLLKLSRSMNNAATGGRDLGDGHVRVADVLDCAHHGCQEPVALYLGRLSARQPFSARPRGHPACVVGAGHLVAPASGRDAAAECSGSSLTRAPAHRRRPPLIVIRATHKRLRRKLFDADMAC
jgi:hypothetical protein